MRFLLREEKFSSWTLLHVLRMRRLSYTSVRICFKVIIFWVKLHYSRNILTCNTYYIYIYNYLYIYICTYSITTKINPYWAMYQNRDKLQNYCMIELSLFTFLETSGLCSWFSEVRLAPQSLPITNRSMSTHPRPGSYLKKKWTDNIRNILGSKRSSVLILHYFRFVSPKTWSKQNQIMALSN